MPPNGELVLRIVAAFVLGTLAGVERQWHHKHAGIRTHTLVAVGAASFTLVSMALSGPTSSMVIAAGVVTGIGFIGGGVIMHQGAAVQGINTAATLWTTASIGLAAGAGYYELMLLVFAVLVVVQLPLAWVERWIDRRAGRAGG
ncbi:MAG TPA: MgtC/SapB family protein [Candidatus Binatia bacterium]|nr:MgtC/SapB family protein [Candidatus Binatia bacterium]